MYTRHAYVWRMVVADIDPYESSVWARSSTSYLVWISKEIAMTGFDPDGFKEQLKEELADQNLTIIREMIGKWWEQSNINNHPLTLMLRTL